MLNGYRTYTGLLVALVPTLANLFGYDVSTTFSEDFGKILEDFLTLVGLAMAFYGRAVAEVPGFLVKRK